VLEAVAREGQMKPQQAGKCLAGAVVICEMWRLTVELYICSFQSFDINGQ
jgi:hypothetical protein